MSNTGAIAAAALVLASASPAETGSPIRIGASLSQTGVYAALGQNQLRGYRFCVRLPTGW